MVEAETAGDPSSQHKWVRSSLRQLSERLSKAGHSASPPTVGRLLRKLDFSLKSNRKQKEAGSDHQDRDEQFSYIEEKKQEFLQSGMPVISVDAKKKELVGDFKNGGRAWCRQSEEVNVHDFLSSAEGRAVPYGIYDLGKNQGYVYGGESCDTSEFAVDVIARWWQQEGKSQYRKAETILILADGGGSNGCRVRSWKQNLQQEVSDRLGLEVTVCHYPTGCSKWNPIEHRLFSYISINWAGKPLRRMETILGYIAGTRTKAGLKVKAFVQKGIYEKGKKVSDAEMERLNLERHNVCPNWNYTIRPQIRIVPDT
jgi:hypothetical protein